MGAAESWGFEILVFGVDDAMCTIRDAAGNPAQGYVRVDSGAGGLAWHAI
jgi:hypothetical protein